MAKRNSTKTATKEALQSSEPRIQTFKGWQGMNIETSQRSWTPLEQIPKTVDPGYRSHTSNLVFKQTDEKPNMALIQNNLRCLADGSLESRNMALGSRYNYLFNLPTAKTFGVIDDDTRLNGVSTAKPISYSFDNFEFTDIIYMLEDQVYAKLNCIVNVYAKKASAVTLGTTTPDGVIKQGNVLARISIANLTEDKNNWTLIKLDSKTNATTATTSLPYICDYANIITCVYSCLNTVLVASTLQKTVVYTTATSSLLKTGLFQDMTTELTKRIGQGILYSDELSNFSSVTQVDSAKYIAEPTEVIKVEDGNKSNPVICKDEEDQEGWGTFWYTISTKFGSTLFNVDASTKKAVGTAVFFKVRPVNFTASKYVKCSVTFTQNRASTLINAGATDIEIWFSEKGSTTAMVIGRVNFPKTVTKDITLTFSFYGSMYDTDQLATMSLSQPDFNTTQGPEVTRMKYIDSRLYFYGSVNRPYRLYMGGTSGMELCISRGKGGGFIDCEPGSGSYITSVHKFKTQSGATIITFLTGNKNTGRQKRYNLIETQITITSEIAENSWKYEEVTNVIGTNSYNGALVCADGLYMLSRYGLYVTTQAMEYNSQLRSQKVSSAISPIFENRLSPVFDNAVMIFIDEIIYFCFGCEDDSEFLDHIIFCYDVNTHAFYTYSYGDETTDILTILPIDYIGWTEGIGIVTPEHIDIIPTVGDIRQNTGNQISYDYNSETHKVNCFENQYNAVFKQTITPTKFYSLDPKLLLDNFYIYNTDTKEETSWLGKRDKVYWPRTEQVQGYVRPGSYFSFDNITYNNLSIPHEVVNYSYHVNLEKEVVCLDLTGFTIKIFIEEWQRTYQKALFINAATLKNLMSISNLVPTFVLQLSAMLPKRDFEGLTLSETSTMSRQRGSIDYEAYGVLASRVEIRMSDGSTKKIALKIIDREGYKPHAIEMACNHVETVDEILENNYVTVYSDNPVYPTFVASESEAYGSGFIEYEDYYMGDLSATATTETPTAQTGIYYSDYNGHVSINQVPAMHSRLSTFYLNENSVSMLQSNYYFIYNGSYQFKINLSTFSDHVKSNLSYELHLPNTTKYNKFKINKVETEEPYLSIINNYIYFNKNITKSISCNYLLTGSTFWKDLPLFDEETNLPNENLYIKGTTGLMENISYGTYTLYYLKLGTPNTENQNIFTGLNDQVYNPNRNSYLLDDTNPECILNYNQLNAQDSHIVTISQQVPLLWQTGELSTTTPAQGFMNLAQLEFHFDYLHTDINGLKITINAVDYYGREIEVSHTFTQTTELRNYIAPLRVDAYVESYNIRMEGTASLRMTHIIARVYVQGKKARQVYGHEATMHWITPNGDTDTNVEISSYNDLYRTILP